MGGDEERERKALAVVGNNNFYIILAHDGIKWGGDQQNAKGLSCLEELCDNASSN